VSPKTGPRAGTVADRFFTQSRLRLGARFAQSAGFETVCCG
jgi:hypothetical protein